MQLHGYRILVIDNDEVASGELQNFLISKGFGVISAYDGAAGLQLAEIYKPDLILMEMELPQMDGFKVLGVLAEHPVLRQTPVVFVTKLTSENLMIKALEYGADDYIVKPYNKLELMARVKASLRRGRRFRITEDAMGGNLADVGLAELLQTSELGKKTTLINLPDMGANLFIEDGMLVHAQIGSFEGLPAIQRIVFLERGTFSMSFEPFPKTLVRTPMPIQYVLLDAMRYVDELRGMLDVFAEEKNPLLRIKDTGVEDLDSLKDLSPITLNDLIVRIEGDMKESAEKITGAFSKGGIENVSHTQGGA
jgi:CheY-like chemotaxis protein